MTNEKYQEAVARLKQIKTEMEASATKFQAFATPRRKLCSDHLIRTQYAPALQLKRAEEKIVARHSELVKEVKLLEQKILEHALTAEPVETPVAPEALADEDLNLSNSDDEFDI